MAVHSLQNAPSSLAQHPVLRAVPYRIVALEQILRSRPVPRGTRISIEPFPLSLDEEKRLFPIFSIDPYYLHAWTQKRSFAISGVSEWGVFWYRVDEEKPQHPESGAALWATIDRLTSVAEFVAGRL